MFDIPSILRYIPTKYWEQIKWYLEELHVHYIHVHVMCIVHVVRHITGPLKCHACYSPQGSTLIWYGTHTISVSFYSGTTIDLHVKTSPYDRR